MKEPGKKIEKNGEPIVKQGSLRKQGGQYKSWKDRWFTLTNEALSYYKTVDTEEPIKRIPLKDVKSCRLESAENRPSRFPFYFSVETEGRVYVISARNESERIEWVDSISKLILKFTQKPIDAAKELEALAASEKQTEIIPQPFVPKDRPEFKGQTVKHVFPMEEFVSDFKVLTRSELLSDVSFSVQGQLFHSHKAIISCRCPALAKGFPVTSNKGSIPVVVVEELKPETFSSVLDFIYTGSVDLNPNNVVYIHFAAVAFNLDRLQSMCEVYIRDNINVSNVLAMLVVANKLKEEELERFFLGFMKDVDNYTNVIKQPQASEIAQTNKDLYVTMSQVLAQPAEAFHHQLDKVVIPPIRLTTDTSTLLQTLDHADLRILTKDGELFAHKVIIAARCNAFLEEGSLGIDTDAGNSSTNKFQILKFPTLESQVVHIFLQIIYSNIASLDYLNDVYGLIELADRVNKESIINVCEDMMRRNLMNETALKILMVSSEYELVELKKEALKLIKREAPEILKRSDLRVLLSQWPWNLIDIIRTLVKTDEELTDEDEDDNIPESEDELDDEDNPSTELI